MAEVHRDGNAYVVILSHEEVNEIAVSSATAATLYPPIAPFIVAVMPVIVAMDNLGGRNGVEISGSIGSPILLILPRPKGVFGSVFKTVADIGKFIVEYHPYTLLASLYLKGIEAVIGLFGKGKGEVYANAGPIGENEKLSMITCTDGRIGILSYRGYFTADDDTKSVIANREDLLDYEKWTMIQHPDGRVSFRSHPGKWMCADRNVGKRVMVDRSDPGEWEKFTVHFPSAGLVALQDSEGQFLTVH